MNSTQILGRELNYACVGGGPKGPGEKVGRNQKEICLWITELCVGLSVKSLLFFFNWVNFSTMYKSGTRKLNLIGLKCKKQSPQIAKKIEIRERETSRSNKIKKSNLYIYWNSWITTKLQRQGKIPEGQVKKLAMENHNDRDISCCMS